MTYCIKSFDARRSLLAHLAAANCFTEHHLESAESKKIIDAGEVFYIAVGFLLSCTKETAFHRAST